MFTNTPKTLSLIFILAICFTTNSHAQAETSSDLGTEVTALGGIGGKAFRCYPTDKLLVSKQEFKKLLNDERCSVLNSFKVDFSKHTLINYRVGGDCNMRIASKIFRNDKTKTYTIEVKNYWGRCRAGGSYHSWNVVEKIPDGYKVELKEIQLDYLREKTRFSSALPNYPSVLRSIDHIETKEVDLKECVQMFRQNRYIFKDKDSYLKQLRKDAQTKRCETDATNLDFQRNSYIGVLIRSGYCRYPKGLKYRLVKNNSKKQYVLNISYIDPEGQVCRALSRYELWLQTPKLIEDFDVVYKVGSRPKNSRSIKSNSPL